MIHLTPIALAAAALSLHAATDPQPTGTPLTPAPANTPNPEPTAPPEVKDQILRAAADYTKWKRVSDDIAWAPTLCRAAPAPGVEPGALVDSHAKGRKLYYLFAKDADAYWQTSHGHPSKDRYSPEIWGPLTIKPGDADRTSPIGQIVAKESWVPEYVADAPHASLQWNPQSASWVQHLGSKDHPDYEVIDGKLYKPGEKGPLFLMLKLDPKTPNTDQGWVYATLTPDGKTITAAGQIAACIACHKETTRDRLYGSRTSWPMIQKDDGTQAKSLPTKTLRPIEPPKMTEPAPSPAAPVPAEPKK